MNTAGRRPVESVWDYPRPPRVERDDRHVVVLVDGVPVADSRRCLRVLETSHPPVFYIPRDDTRSDLLTPSGTRTWCEWKGVATYWDFSPPDPQARRADIGWSYESPSPAYSAIARCLAFYPSRVTSCSVDGESVVPQPGDFYGGWITGEIEGPFKGPPGTRGW
ncbi:DUF427 domain-containing protein [Streptomyces sp. NPDC006430]|uniref:DUF427 domain-containing protein n=1 Tax=Streptomyces sp. NPDC006430 TaxID=3154299 RepID=UPI0033A56750